MNFKLFDNLPNEAKEIRYKVFTLEQGFKAEDDLDDMDVKSIHIIVYKDDNPIATARMFMVDELTYHIGRLAVLKEHRNKGVGSYILSIFEKVAKEKGASRVELGAQIDKTSFYKKNGYKEYGDIFLDAGYPHILMNKERID